MNKVIPSLMLAVWGSRRRHDWKANRVWQLWHSNYGIAMDLQSIAEVLRPVSSVPTLLEHGSTRPDIL